MRRAETNLTLHPLQQLVHYTNGFETETNLTLDSLNQWFITPMVLETKQI